MTKTSADRDVAERLREWMDQDYGSRGRFTLLETESGIAAQSWKNVYYKRQLATDAMLNFVQKKSTDLHQWVMTGVRPPVGDDYPFLNHPPSAAERETLTARLLWTIKEWAAPRGALLFQYLAGKTPHETADQWAAVFLGKQQPTAKMIEVVCSARPHFAAWIVTGQAFRRRQVDPSDAESITRWTQEEIAAGSLFVATVYKPKKSTPHHPTLPGLEQHSTDNKAQDKSNESTKSTNSATEKHKAPAQPEKTSRRPRK